MRTIELDASGWKDVLEFASSLKAALGSPDWHGTLAAAFIDSMIAGGINALEPPYVVKVVNAANLEHEVMKFIQYLSSWIEDARLRRLVRTGEDAAVSLQIEN